MKFLLEKTALIALISLAWSSSAFADGFICQSRGGYVNVKVFNYSNPEQGTRRASQMILSKGRGSDLRTIAVFTHEEGRLSNESAVVVADLKWLYSDEAEAKVRRTEMTRLTHIILDVDFSYRSPIEHGAKTVGWLQLIKDDGREIEIEMSCERYLKN